ncbi:MAG TPA: LD-carboxypeptidase [Caldithrix abyssi]|uniref:LD-carboxypeptidase n=1 Tax=Caldithrix abyssi TaxID=187145 RepID=A0A7V5PQC6_CALAY|nr:LD-carboxypeptidase [Caldithrix abyssi]
MTTRRTFLKTSALGSLFSLFPAVAFAKGKKSHEIILPPKLNPGDTVGLITPASPLFEAHRTLIEAHEKLANLGFKTKVGKNIFKKYGYLAGTVQERVEDLHDMFADPEVKAIMTVRGGYGSAQLLPYINYDLIRKNPKILVGYSDITALLVGIHEKTGLVTFHGPVAVSTFTDFTRKYFLKVLTQAQPVGEIEDAPYEENLQTSNRVWTYRSGKAEGRLMGGNLTLLQMTLGTPYEFDSDDRILFFEEVSEEPYDLDRMLTHFKLAGKFDRCRGVVFDKLSSVKPADYKPGFNSSLSVEEVIDNIFKDYDFPVCVGLSLGHIANKPTMPLGIKVRLDADSGRISLLEKAVR